MPGILPDGNVAGEVFPLMLPKEAVDGIVRGVFQKDRAGHDGRAQEGKHGEALFLNGEERTDHAQPDHDRRDKMQAHEADQMEYEGGTFSSVLRVTPVLTAKARIGIIPVQREPRGPKEEQRKHDESVHVPQAAPDHDQAEKDRRFHAPVGIVDGDVLEERGKEEHEKRRSACERGCREENVLDHEERNGPDRKGAEINGRVYE